jgi:hypothetical protein
LSYLSSAQGRTNANCCAVDSFLLLDGDWGVRWVELPPEFVEVFALMAEALHDTVSAPDVAENFGCTPEQILEKAYGLHS